MSDLISVIIPVYNVELYLKKCLDSVISQTYRNIEIILVDDGSTDTSGIICDEYAGKDRRIKVIHKQNGGLSDARNVGLNCCTGRYVTFIDSDDFVAHDYIENLYVIMTTTESDVAICRDTEFYSDQEPSSLVQGKAKIITFNNIQALKQLYGKYAKEMTTVWGKLYKIWLFSDIKFPVGRVHEDLYVDYKLWYKSSRLALTTKKLYFYRKRTGSITSEKFNYRYRLDYMEALSERMDFFKCTGLRSLADRTYISLLSYALESYILAQKVHKEHEKLFLEKLNEVYGLVKDSSHPFLRFVTKIALVNPKFVYSLIKSRRNLKRILFSLKSSGRKRV